MMLARVADGFSLWMDVVAQELGDILARLRPDRVVAVAEEEPGVFTLAGEEGASLAFRLDGAVAPQVAARLAGRRVALRLRADHFLFRPLELPRAAEGFLAGIVRAQIDRLTPWSAPAAAYGWTSPWRLGEERIAILVAATARARITPYVERLKELGARSVEVSTCAEGQGEGSAEGPVGERAEGAEAIMVLGDASGSAGFARLRRAIVGVVAAALLVTTASVVIGEIAGARLDAEQEALDEQVAARRRVLMMARGGAEGAALGALEQRRRELAPTVLVLEALSRALPDDTYATQIEVDGDKVQVNGISHDAAALIPLMERSRHFIHATFVAPTVPVPNGGGERFHIEAQVAVPLKVAP